MRERVKESESVEERERVSDIERIREKEESANQQKERRKITTEYDNRYQTRKKL